MKFLNVLSILGLVAITTACGSSQPTTNMSANGINPYGTTVYPTTSNYASYGPVFTGPYGNGVVTSQTDTYTASVNVNAGDRLSVNLTSATFTVNAYCNGTLIDLYSNLLGGGSRQAWASVSLNGQALVSGTFQAPSSGVLTLTVTASSVGINCPWGQPTISGYQMYIGNVVIRN